MTAALEFRLAMMVPTWSKPEEEEEEDKRRERDHLKFHVHERFVSLT